MKFTVATSRAMQKLGGVIAVSCDPGCIVYLQGELGAGKTTLVRGFLHELGYLGYVRSPTFNLFEIYRLGTKTVCHFDLYRLAYPEELTYIGATDYFTENNICLIEWPEHGKGFLPPADLLCKLNFVAEGCKRVVKITAVSSQGKKLIKNIVSVQHNFA